MSSSSSDEQRAEYEFKRRLEELEEIQGEGTELISLYIPPDKNLRDVANQLRDEIGQAQNIKSKSTRKNVSAALDSILGRLKTFDSVPNNGLIFFVGHKSVSGDKTEMVQHVFEPPRPINIFLYRCDSRFHLEPLEDLVATEEIFGLLVVDRSEASIGMLRGSRVDVISNIQSNVPSKHSKGGQSAQRFERLIEEAAYNFFKKVAEKANRAFQREENLQGLLVGGPGATKDEFLDEELLHHELQDAVIDTVDTGYTDEYGLRELVENAQETLRQRGLMQEKELVDRFLREIKKQGGGLSAYGEDHVRTALRMGAVDTLLVSEKLRKERVTVRCTSCDHEEHETTEDVDALEAELGACPECSSNLELADHEDLVEELSTLAGNRGSEVEMISGDSEEGELLWNAFGGVAAILRFELDLNQATA